MRGLRRDGSHDTRASLDAVAANIEENRMPSGNHTIQ